MYCNISKARKEIIFTAQRQPKCIYIKSRTSQESPVLFPMQRNFCWVIEFLNVILITTLFRTKKLKNKEYAAESDFLIS